MSHDLTNILDEMIYAIDPDAVEAKDEYHIRKARKAALRALDVITDNYLLRSERLEDTKAAAEENLPVPRLQLVWNETEWHDETFCWYQLVLNRGSVGDARQGPDGTIKITLGTTKTSGSPIDEYTNELTTPFRDGAHILWDMENLGLPGFVVYNDQYRELKKK